MVDALPGGASAETAVRVPSGVAETLTTVESVAVALAEPPPDTVTEFTCGVLALAFTFTVTAIGG
jgi:hypothetical protein